MTASVKPLPELKKRKLTSLQKRLPNFSLGAAGESRACTFLKAHNYQVLETNVRLGLHEVDIIAVDQATQTLVFCEVKTRKSSFFGSPSLAVSPKKIRSLQQVARTYLQNLAWRGPYRIDCLAVLPNKIEHYKNITW